MRTICIGAALIPAVSAADGAPPNDNFADAILIPSIPVVVTDTTLDSTLEPDEPLSLYQLSSVWYRWIAPATGILRVRITDSLNLMVGRIFTGYEIDNLVSVATCSSQDEANVDVRNFTEYWFQIWADQPTVLPRRDGPFTLRLEYNPSPVNDNFVNRIRLTNRIECISFRNLAATLEAWETPLVPGGRTVWYQWRAPESGEVRIQKEITPRLGVVGVYSGAEDSLGVLLTNNGASCAREVSFNAVAGQVYQLVFGECSPTDLNVPLGHSWTLTLNGASQLVDVAQETNGSTTVTLYGDSARTYVLERSTDLTNWAPVQTNSAQSTSRVLTDLNTANSGHRFYRARVLE